MTERSLRAGPRRATPLLAWLWGLALLVALAQSAGLMHRVLHGASGEWHGAQALTLAASGTLHAGATSAPVGADPVHALEHGKRLDCQVFDQLAAATPLAHTAPSAMAPAPGWGAATALVSVDLARVPAFQAQAPPTLL